MMAVDLCSICLHASRRHSMGCDSTPLNCSPVYTHSSRWTPYRYCRSVSGYVAQDASNCQQ